MMTRNDGLEKGPQFGSGSTLQGTNISHLGKGKTIFKNALVGGYVSSEISVLAKQGRLYNNPLKILFFWWAILSTKSLDIFMAEYLSIISLKILPLNRK